MSVVMGAANTYLGLKAGMTVSASIPAAVVAMAILRGLLRRDSILESNLVQTSASAGESLAAGIIFTMPALILIGVWDEFDYLTVTLIAMTGGLLGVLFMIPMRRVFVVDNPELKFPEGLACAEVLRAGGGGDTRDTWDIIAGLGIGALFKLAISWLTLVRNSVEGAVILGGRVFYFGSDISPALLSVGVIVGLEIGVQIFLGGAIGWLVVLPTLSANADAASAIEEANRLWSSQVRYMGVGAMAVGGVYSIWKVRHGLVIAVAELAGQFRASDDQKNSADPRQRDLPGVVILIASIATLLTIAGIYFFLLQKHVGITTITVVAMVTMSFFFTAVASYIVGLVGNSNSPVSGMTITAVLATGLLIFLFGYRGEEAMIATLGVAGVVCCVACTAGDACNDLKTGLLVGASPRNQQLLQILGVVAAAFVMSPVMTVLHEGSLASGTGGIGGTELPAPQASLFASLAEAFFGKGSIPVDMVVAGVVCGVLILIGDVVLQYSKRSFRLHIMPVAVGIYLPLSLSVPILLGGLLNWVIVRGAARRGEARKTSAVKCAVLIASGLIAGESLIGVGWGVTTYLGRRPWDGDVLLADALGIPSAALHTWLFDPLSVGLLLCACAWIYVRALRRGQ